MHIYIVIYVVIHIYSYISVSSKPSKTQWNKEKCKKFKSKY